MPWAPNVWLDRETNKAFKKLTELVESACGVIDEQAVEIELLKGEIAALKERMELPIFSVE